MIKKVSRIGETIIIRADIIRIGGMRRAYRTDAAEGCARRTYRAVPNRNTSALSQRDSYTQCNAASSLNAYANRDARNN